MVENLKTQQHFVIDFFICNMVDIIYASTKMHDNDMLVNYIKHKKNNMSFEEIIENVRIKVQSRIDPGYSKANLIENNSLRKQNVITISKRKGHCVIFIVHGQYIKRAQRIKDNKNPPKFNLTKGDDIFVAVVVSKMNMVNENKD